MPRIPSKLSSLLQSLTVQLPVLLGRNLVGVYLYGSVTHNGFNPKRSDVDCLVVTRRDLSDAQLRRLGGWHAHMEKSNPWTSRLQISLTICRILYSTEKRSLTSKPAAAKWVIKKRPRRWTKIINQGLTYNEIGRESDIPLRPRN